MGSKQSHGSLCVYCRESPATTRDHVPPRCLFPDPKPSDLISVPCCAQCNGGFSMDDEYFRSRLLLRKELFFDTNARAAFDPVIRSLSNEHKRGFSSQFRQDFFGVDGRRNSNFCPGEDPTYDVDVPRMERVVERIISGLFYDRFQCAVPAPHQVLAHELKGTITDAYGPGITAFLLPINSGDVGDGKFHFIHSRKSDCERGSVWILWFFRHIKFIGFTGPKT